MRRSRGAVMKGSGYREKEGGRHGGHPRHKRSGGNTQRPLHKILERLDGDANKLYALGEVDKAVLRRLVEGEGDRILKAARLVEFALLQLAIAGSN